MSLRWSILIAIFSAFLFSSCNSLKPVLNQGSVQRLHHDDLARFNGDYESVSKDTTYPTLASALTFTDKKELSDLIWMRKHNAWGSFVRLRALSTSKLLVTVYKDGKRTKRKRIKGHIEDDYFHFRMTKFAPAKPFYVVLNTINRQKNRIALLPSGDLTLDSYGGGILLLVIFPTFGGDNDGYGMVYKRRN